MLITRLFLLAIAALGILMARQSPATGYRLESIAEDLATVPGSDEAPVILNDGNVLYVLDHQLMRGDTESSTLVYEATEGSSIPPYSIRSIAFNSVGDFVALCRAGSRQATLVRYRNSGTELLDRRPALWLGPADINDKGAVAYAVRSAERLTQIIYHDGKNPRSVARSKSLNSLTMQTPSLNNLGQMAVSSHKGVLVIDARGEKITTTRIVTAGPLGGFDGLTMNDTGRVAFRVKRPTVGLYAGAGGKVTKLVDTSESFATLGVPSLNNAGQVAFHAVLKDGREAIFVSTEGANAQVVATGDELAGSVVTALRFGQQGLNDRGQVAFWALSLDGTEKIYRATPDPK